MKKFSILLSLSLLINAALFIWVLNLKKHQEPNYIQNMRDHTNLSDEYTFKEIFINKNDSIYNHLFTRSFKTNAVQAYLLACTYYGITQDKERLEQVEMIRSELKSIYGIPPANPKEYVR